MKLNLITMDIHTDKGEYIKTLDCPFKINWDSLEVVNSDIRKCTNCDHVIIDTKDLTDNDLLQLVRQNPDTCIKIDLNQKNLLVE